MPSRNLLASIFGAVALLVLGGCHGKPASSGAAPSKLTVMASIAPLADFARNVGGDLVDVQMVVPPGASPHTFEPNPAQLRALSDARVFVMNGIGLEPWADDLVQGAHNPNLIVVRTGEGLPIIGGGEHGTGNPHVWLDPIDAMHQVEKIRDALIEADPGHADEYRHNADAYLPKLKDLDAEIRAAVATFHTKDFIAQHAAWVYFAKRYGLNEAGVIEPAPGRETSPASIAAVVDTVRRTHAKAIFAEPQLSRKAADVIAAETGVKVLLLNPLGSPPDYSYLATMRQNLATMKEALG